VSPPRRDRRRRPRPGMGRPPTRPAFPARACPYPRPGSARSAVTGTSPHVREKTGWAGSGTRAARRKRMRHERAAGTPCRLD
jgi:hypothetical protein